MYWQRMYLQARVFPPTHDTGWPSDKLLCMQSLAAEAAGEGDIQLNTLPLSVPNPFPLSFSQSLSFLLSFFFSLSLSLSPYLFRSLFRSLTLLIFLSVYVCFSLSLSFSLSHSHLTYANSHSFQLFFLSLCPILSLICPLSLCSIVSLHLPS